MAVKKYIPVRALEGHIELAENQLVTRPRRSKSEIGWRIPKLRHQEGERSGCAGPLAPGGKQVYLGPRSVCWKLKPVYISV